MSDAWPPLAEIELGDLGSSARADLLRYALRQRAPESADRIFVNRTLRLETIRHVGFDLDWTLADYRRLPLEELTFELAIERLIEGHGYPVELRRLELNPDFPRRGLLIDKREGTVVRMNRHRYVGQAYRGRSRLEPAETIRLYRQEPINPASSRFYHVDSLFELPETNVYSELIELSSSRPSLGLPDSAQIFADVRRAVDWVHSEGPLKERVLADLDRFLERDLELGLALERLRLGDRRLILITNSPWSYTDGLCSFLLDGLLTGVERWRDLFDLVVVSAAKPRFFRSERPFRELDDSGQVTGECDRPEWGKVYAGGSLAGLMQLLDCRGEHVLYVGDHIYGDIVTSKTESTWRTALIVKELDEELESLARLGPEMAQLGALRLRLRELGQEMDRVRDVVTLGAALEEGGTAVAAGAVDLLRARFDHLKGRHKSLLNRARALDARVAADFNPYWGSFFKQDGSKSLFASQLEAYACLYTSSVTNFCHYGTNHYFRVIYDPMRHDRAWNGAARPGETS